MPSMARRIALVAKYIGKIKNKYFFIITIYLDFKLKTTYLSPDVVPSFPPPEDIEMYGTPSIS